MAWWCEWTKRMVMMVMKMVMVMRWWRGGGGGWRSHVVGCMAINPSLSCLFI